MPTDTRADAAGLPPAKKQGHDVEITERESGPVRLLVDGLEMQMAGYQIVRNPGQPQTVLQVTLLVKTINGSPVGIVTGGGLRSN